MRGIAALRMRSAVVLPSYVETGSLGNATGVTGYNASANEKNVIPITVPSGGVWAKRLVLGVYSSGGVSTARAIVYAGPLLSTSALVKAGVTETIPAAASSRVDKDMWLNADHSATFFPAGSYVIGVHGSDGSDWCCLGSGSPTNYSSGDTFADGAAATFGSVSTFATYIVCSMPYSLTN